MGKRRGKFTRVGENLYRYSTTKTYFAVFRHNGKLKWKSLKTSDRELAGRKLAEEIRNAGRVDPATEKMTLDALVALFENGLGKYDQGTKDNKMAIIRRLKASWRFGLDMAVADITEAQLETWLSQHRERMTRTGYNPYVIFIRQLFNLAVASRAIAVSPAERLKMVKPESPIRLTPTWQQFERIVINIREFRGDHSDSQATANLVEFMGLAGVGMAECANLKGEHIDFEANKILLYRGKTDSAYSIPIFPQLKPFLSRLKENGVIQTGKPVFDVKDPKKGLTAACKRLKLPQFTSRSLRRCFITRAIEKGIDFKTIAAWQGRRDGGVLIAKTYSHLRNEHAEAMAKKLV